MNRFLLCLLFASMTLSASAQQPSTDAKTPHAITDPGAGDPLKVGKAAMQSGDYASARTFFSTYTQQNPQDAEAWFYLGGTDLALDRYADAVQDFRTTVDLKPDVWSAHNNLSMALAESEDWPAFDKERAVIKAARDAKTPGLSEDHDIIDVLRANGKTYQVWYFYKLHGHYNVRYVAIEFDKDGNAKTWIQAESDDVDQAFFKQDHPKEAATGDRRFSLDSYSQGSAGIPSQALHKFYDGEPTYEQFRADVLKTISGESKPVSSTTPGTGPKK